MLTEFQVFFIIKSSLSMVETALPLRSIIQDENYAWELLDSEIKLELSQQLTGDLISHLIQVYMRGVEKTNSILDIRETFFKTRLNSLMAKQQVRRTLDHQLQNVKKKEGKGKPSKRQNLNRKKELKLKEKKVEMEMRVLYGAEEHSSKVLSQLLSEQSLKQKILTTKIDRIMDNHQERLMKRIKQRKLKTMTAKSSSDALFINSNEKNEERKKFSQEKKRVRQQLGSHTKTIEEGTPRRKKQVQQDRINKSLGQNKAQQWKIDSSNEKCRQIAVDIQNLSVFETPQKV